MRLRLTTAAALLILTAGCASAPELSPAESAKVVTAALGECDGAVNALNMNYGHATPVGVVRLARAVKERCGAASTTLINARLPGRIFEPCQYAGLAASSVGDAAETAANSLKPSDEVQLEDAVAKADEARNQCEASLTA